MDRADQGQYSYDSRLRQTADGRRDHVTIISPHFPFTVCRFSVMAGSFVLAINMRIILHPSPVRIIYFEET